MSASRLLARLAAGLMALASPFAPAAAESPTETVRAFHEAMENGDRDAALRLLVPELLVYEGGHVEASRAEYSRQHLGADIRFSQQARRTVTSSTEQVHGDSALVTGTFRADWSGTEIAGTETMVLVRSNGQWRIQHIHWSSHRVADDD